MDVIEQFEELREKDFTGAVKGLISNASSVDSVRDLLRSQIKPQNFTQVLFEWLYKCIQLKDKSNDLFTFVLQFTPDLLLVYLYAVYENNSKLKAMSEAPLLGMLMEVEKSKPPMVQVPTLSKASVYHKATVQLAQSGLTEANLLRHNQTEYAPTRTAFSGKIITVNNRLHFLSTVMNLFADHITTFCNESKVAFCEACITLCVQGMGPFFTSQISQLDNVYPRLEELSSMRRYSISDSLVTSLLHGVRMCLFKSCHFVAMDALRVLRLRAEYELLTTAIQVSHALTRLVEGVEPTEIPLEVERQSSYHGNGRPRFMNDPSEVHSALNSHILKCELAIFSPTTSDSSVATLRISKSTDV